MDCSVFEERLSDYLDGLLAQQDASRFRAHALQCRECRALLDEIKAALVNCKSEIEAPAGLEDALLMIPIEQAPVDCAGFEDLITEFLDGFVPAATYHRFEEHAAGCDECSSLLTSIVYAVAACHSVHTYEEVEAPAELISNLIGIIPKRKETLATRIANRVSAFAAQMLPRPSASARWRLATASLLMFATVAFLFLGFSDDGTAKGIFRQASVKAGDIFDQGAAISQTTDEVMAQFGRVGKDIGGILTAPSEQGDAGAEASNPERNQNTNRAENHGKN